MFTTPSNANEDTLEDAAQAGLSGAENKIWEKHHGILRPAGLSLRLEKIVGTKESAAWVIRERAHGLALCGAGRDH